MTFLDFADKHPFVAFLFAAMALEAVRLVVEAISERPPRTKPTDLRPPR